MWARACLLGASVACGALACNALTGVGDVEFSGSTGAGASAAAASSSGAAGGTGDRCSNNAKDGDETDVDCGGATCPACANGLACSDEGDCASGVCTSGMCCSVACDGPCLSCNEADTGVATGTCAQVKPGSDPHDDCPDPSVCAAGACHACTDGMQNGDELGVDCGGATCPPCAEDCTNGVDDNGDQLADCADPICGGYQCAAAPPSDWLGPVLFYAGNGVVPSCGADFPTSQLGGSGPIDAPPATCSMCACSAPTGLTCGLPTLTFFDANNCTGTPTVYTTPAPGCTTQTEQNKESVLGGVVPVVGGSCAASGGTPSKNQAVFPDQSLVCSGGVTGAGCNGGEVCVKTGAPPFVTTACIVHAGNVACPGAPYTQQHVMFDGIQDDRTCTGCICGSPIGASCEGGHSNLYNQSSLCGGSDKLVPNDGSCIDLTSTPHSISYDAPNQPPMGGVCAVSGGQPTGGAVGTGATTICCSR